MKINVLFTHESREDLYFSGKVTVVIDVLRASNTIITALENGAKEIVPVTTVDTAVKISKGLFGGSTILGGERNTKKIEGFYLGNSPLEYTHEKVNSKTIVYFTTNGSKAVIKARFSDVLYICAFSNIGAVAGQLKGINKDVEILCAGNPSGFSMEDLACAGMLVKEISTAVDDNSLSDSAKIALVLYDSVKNDLYMLLRETEHGQVLLKNDYSEDIMVCSRVNTSKVIPYLSGNVIKLLPGK